MLIQCWEQWEVLLQARCVITCGIHTSSQVYPAGWRPPEVTEARNMNVLCLRPKGNGFKHVMSQQEIGVLKLCDSVAKYLKVTESSIIFGQLCDLRGQPRRGFLKKQRCASHLPYAQCLNHEFQWPLLAPAYVAYTGCSGRTSAQLFNLLSTAASTGSD